MKRPDHITVMACSRPAHRKMRLDIRCIASSAAFRFGLRRPLAEYLRIDPQAAATAPDTARPINTPSTCARCAAPP